MTTLVNCSLFGHTEVQYVYNKTQTYNNYPVVDVDDARWRREMRRAARRRSIKHVPAVDPWMPAKFAPDVPPCGRYWVVASCVTQGAEMAPNGPWITSSTPIPAPLARMRGPGWDGDDAWSGAAAGVGWGGFWGGRSLLAGAAATLAETRCGEHWVRGG